MLSVAAIIPLYNKADYVIEAVESILCQTRLPDEIVIVDDGSTDGSGELVCERYSSDPRFIIVRQENKGPGAARNAAIKASKSSFLAFLDADDKWLPEKLEKQVAFMEKNVSWMLSFSNSIGYNEATKETYYKENLNIANKFEYLKNEYFPQKSYIATNSVMIRRDVLQEVGGFDETLRTSQDADLWLRIMLRYDFGYIPERLVWVRRGYPQSFEAIERARRGNDLYFSKHRYTFGRDIKGQIAWRAAYSSVLRANSIWYFKNSCGYKAIRELARAVFLWPFFKPNWIFKAALEFLLGASNYEKMAGPIKRIIAVGRNYFKGVRQ